jgi:hypothetical protein
MVVSAIMVIFFINSSVISSVTNLKKKMGDVTAPYLDFIRGFVRQYCYEGMMSIRENAAENQFYSDKHF